MKNTKPTFNLVKKTTKKATKNGVILKQAIIQVGLKKMIIFGELRINYFLSN